MEPTAQQAAERFVHSFQQCYGQGGPRWEVSSFEAAAGLAQRRFKFLLAYLHAPSHQVQPFDAHFAVTLSWTQLVAIAGAGSSF